MATTKAKEIVGTDRFIGSVDGTFNDYLRATHVLRQLMIEVQPIRIGHRVATVNINGFVYLAVERDGYVEEYAITNGATR